MYKFYLILLGIFYKEKVCVIGNGMVVDLKVFVMEFVYFYECNVSMDNLKISNRVYVIFLYYLKLDEVEEECKGVNKIGIMKKGIGFVYMDKVVWIGIWIVDLLDWDVFVEKFEWNLEEKNCLFEKMYEMEGFKIEDILDEYYEYG